MIVTSHHRGLHRLTADTLSMEHGALMGAGAHGMLQTMAAPSPRPATAQVTAPATGLASTLFQVFRSTFDETTIAWQQAPGSSAREPSVVRDQRVRARRDLEHLLRHGAAVAC
jgi:hypothetical protein